MSGQAPDSQWSAAASLPETIEETLGRFPLSPDGRIPDGQLSPLPEPRKRPRRFRELGEEAPPLRRKFATLCARLDNAEPEALARIHSPAGLAIDAVTPQEIALSILAQIIQTRRSGQRRA